MCCHISRHMRGQLLNLIYNCILKVAMERTSIAGAGSWLAWSPQPLRTFRHHLTLYHSILKKWFENDALPNNRILFTFVAMLRQSTLCHQMMTRGTLKDHPASPNFYMFLSVLWNSAEMYFGSSFSPPSQGQLKIEPPMLPHLPHPSISSQPQQICYGGTNCQQKQPSVAKWRLIPKPSQNLNQSTVLKYIVRPDSRGLHPPCCFGEHAATLQAWCYRWRSMITCLTWPVAIWPLSRRV